MYFEEVYERVKPFWKQSFSLEGLDETESYVRDIRRNYNEIERKVDFTHKEEYTEWEGMLAFTMYQTLTAFALKKWAKKGGDVLNFTEVPITLFEEYFRKNLKAEGNEEYLKEYRGFRNPLPG